MRQDPREPEETTIVPGGGTTKNHVGLFWFNTEERKLHTSLDVPWLHNTMPPHVLSGKKTQGGIKKTKKKKKLKTARGRVQRGNSRVSRLQVHSLSQALLVSSKLGKGVFSTLCSPSRCFLLSGLSEGREAGIAQHTQSLSILLFLPLYTQTPEDGPGIPLVIPFCARCSLTGSLCHRDSAAQHQAQILHLRAHTHTLGGQTVFCSEGKWEAVNVLRKEKEEKSWINRHRQINPSVFKKTRKKKTKVCCIRILTYLYQMYTI